ncbi:hypothetical protein FHS17_001169 [Paenibacillus lupini]|nr:hypothetical protein [Paenibacillus lupini]
MKRIIGIIFLFIILLSGYTVKNNYYSGIERNDISDLNDTKNIEFVYEYKGHLSKCSGFQPASDGSSRSII